VLAARSLGCKFLQNNVSGRGQAALVWIFSVDIQIGLGLVIRNFSLHQLNKKGSFIKELFLLGLRIDLTYF
jgi:hypothetical protein